MGQQSLREVIVAAGLMTRPEVEGPGVSDQSLHALAFDREREIAEVLAEQLRHPAVVLGESTLDLRSLGFLPIEYAIHYRLIPVAFDDTTLTVVGADIEPTPLLEQLSFASGRRVTMLLGIDVILEASIPELYARAERGEQVLAGAKALFPDPHLEVVRPRPLVGTEYSMSSSSVGQPSPLATPVDHLRAIPAAPASPSAHDVPRTGVYPVPSIPRPSMRAPVPVPQPELGLRSVLVVEDDDAIRTLLVRALQHDGYVLQEAASGDGAAQILRGTRPDLIVLDAMLPGVHGFELCARVKAAPGYAHIPVLMLSAVYKGWEVKREILERHGADAFVEKPFELQYVRHLAAELLQRPLACESPVTENDLQIQGLQAALHVPIKQRDWNAALPLLDQWVRLDPFDAEAWLERGNILLQLGDFAEAMTSYEAATVYDSHLFAGFANLAFTYERLGFFRKAVSTWRRALQLTTDDTARATIAARLKTLENG